jgi:hypothetical protein
MNYKNVQRRIITEILKDIKLEEKVERSYDPHDGSEFEYTMYYDKHRYQWTTNKNTTLQGVIYDKLSPVINEIIEKNRI